MIKLHPKVEMFLSLAKTQAVMVRRFDGRLGGLGFSDFMILYYLSQAAEEKMRRIDLAEKVGLTASGITRLLAPMEKIGLIKREANAQDARVSLVMLARGGKRLLEESLERSELIAEESTPHMSAKQAEELSSALKNIVQG